MWYQVENDRSVLITDIFFSLLCVSVRLKKSLASLWLRRECSDGLPRIRRVEGNIYLLFFLLLLCVYLRDDFFFLPLHSGWSRKRRLDGVSSAQLYISDDALTHTHTHTDNVTVDDSVDFFAPSLFLFYTFLSQSFHDLGGDLERATHLTIVSITPRLLKCSGRLSN